MRFWVLLYPRRLAQIGTLALDGAHGGGVHALRASVESGPQL